MGNKMESPEIDPYLYGYLIYNRGDLAAQWRKESLFNNWSWISLWEKKSLPLPLTRWVTDLNVEENAEKYLYDLAVGVKCLHRMQKMLTIKKKNDKLNYIKNFYPSKDTITILQRQAKEEIHNTHIWQKTCN